jgi:hypothetical protein
MPLFLPIPERNKRSTMVEDLVVLVRGGTSEDITALAYKELPTPELMEAWGDAVKYNPAIIKIKVCAVIIPTPPLCRAWIQRICNELGMEYGAWSSSKHRPHA